MHVHIDALCFDLCCMERLATHHASDSALDLVAVIDRAHALPCAEEQAALFTLVLFPGMLCGAQVLAVLFSSHALS